MDKYFLSVDWDYFINVHKEKSNSYRETQQDILAKWYNEWILGVEDGDPLERHYELTDLYTRFKEEYIPKIKFKQDTKLVLTESHEAGYKEVIRSNCNIVYHLDAHSDLGYGGLEALNYEVNCANWLGVLLKEGRIKEAYIIYSPYTKEYPEEFEEITNTYHVKFITLEEWLERKISFKAVHMCRSGPWTPPWYDNQFYQLAKAFNLEIQDRIVSKRQWHPATLSLGERINYKLGIV